MRLPTLQQLPGQPRRPDSAVALYRDRMVDWRQFQRDVAACAAAAALFPSGSAVALYEEQAYPFATALFGLWAAGCVPVLPSNTTPGTCARLAERVAGFWGAFPHGRPLSDVAATEPGSEHRAAIRTLPADPRLELFTSGSTGEPKPVLKHAVQLDAELLALEQAFGAGLGTSLVLATVSHQHIYGLLFKVLWPLAAGRPFDSRLWRDSAALALSAAEREQGAVWIASPAQLKRLSPDFPWEAARHGVRELFSSGGALPDAAAALWTQGWGRAPLEVYGSTETGGIGWRRQSAGPVWRALPGVAVKAAADGALCLRSPHLPDRHWLTLDDGGRLVGEDGFELTGRRDRIVKIEEKRLALPELEARLLAHPLIDEAAALMLPGERPQLAVVAVLSAAGAAALAAEGRGALGRRLRRDLGELFEPVLLPRRWRFVEALPVNRQGKLEQAALRDLFADSDPPPLLLPELLHSQLSAEFEAKLRVRVPATLAYLPGHFPGQPVLPGVVQIHWAVHFARQLLPLKGYFAGMETLKFRMLTRPGQELELRLQYDPKRERLLFRYSSEAGEHSSGRILFGVET